MTEDVRGRGHKPPQGEPVLDRAFRILASFGPADRSLSLASLSARAGLPTTSTLRIARKLVEAMHGSIGFETEADKGTTFFFEPADIVSQTLNVGVPAPIDIQIVGQNLAGNMEIAMPSASSRAPIIMPICRTSAQVTALIPPVVV